MATPKRLDHHLTDAEFDARLRAVPPDLESTPEEDAEDLATIERGLKQFEQGRYITLEELERKYPDTD